MQGTGTERSLWWRGREELAEGYGSAGARVRLAGLESVAASMGSLCIFCWMEPPRGASLATAFLYVLLSCGVGALNFWLLGPRRERGFGRMTARLAMSWVVVPPAVLLLRADSRLSVMAGVLMGATFALAVTEGRTGQPGGPEMRETGLRFQLFGTEAWSALPPWPVWLLSVLIYATMFALGRQWLLAGMVLGAVCAAMTGFRWSGLHEGREAVGSSMRHEVRRLAGIALAAIVVTATLMMPERVKEAQAADAQAMRAMMHALRGPAKVGKKHAGHRAATDMAGVPKVFLWPEPPKKARALVAPPVAEKARVIHRSMVIPFSGPYIYMEFAALGQRTKPLVAKGSPLKLKVTSVDGSAISMVGRQRLATPIDVVSVRAIEVKIRQIAPLTAVGLGLVLSDTGERHGPQLRLAMEPLPEGAGAREQTVRFSVPAEGRLRSFDQMEVLVKRTARTSQRGARLAIESFTLLPR